MRKKEKERIDVIEVGEYECKKITKGLFYNLDNSMAIIIRDLLVEFAEKHTEGRYPGYYENDPRVYTDIFIEGLTEEDMREALWKRDILEVADEFDRYLKDGEAMEANEIDEMFAKLAFIFPMLWT